MSIDLAPFVDFAVETASSELVRWRGKEALRVDARESLGEEVQRRTSDLDWATGYAKRCPVPGAEPREYQLRLLDLGMDGKMLAGIHFMGLDVDKPFIGLAARTHPFESREQVERVAARLYDDFARFAPRLMSVYQSTAPGEFPLDRVPGVLPDTRLIAGGVADLQTKPVPRALDRIDLACAESMDFWEQYRMMYERFHGDRPALRDRVLMSDLKLMERCADAGGLFKVLVDGEWAGIFAALPSCEHGLRGHLVIEEVLDTPYRGRGFGPALQRRFIDQIPLSAGALVFGTIDVANEPSMRTALRVGRLDVGGWVFLPIGKRGVD